MYGLLRMSDGLEASRRRARRNVVAAVPESRGRLVSFFQLAVTIRVLVAYLVGLAFYHTEGWRSMLGSAVCRPWRSASACCGCRRAQRLRRPRSGRASTRLPPSGAHRRDHRRKGPIFSVEFFPPKTEEATEQLFATARSLRELEPDFVSVTYGAGGSTREGTVEITRALKDELGFETMAHLSCVGETTEGLGGDARPDRGGRDRERLRPARRPAARAGRLRPARGRAGQRRRAGRLHRLAAGTSPSAAPASPRSTPRRPTSRPTSPT